MRVLGIDPGFDRLGLAVLEGDPSRPTLVWSECFEPGKGEPAARLSEVHARTLDALEKYSPDLLAIETLFFSTNKKTALAVAEARGAILSAAGSTKIAVRQFSPAHVKLAVTGHGTAEKSAIARMLPRLLTLPAKRRLDDELDAIAVALAGLSARLH